MEQVLCFPTHLLDKLTHFQGIVTDISRILEYRYEILNPKNLVYMDRDKAEIDFSFKQLIPYVVLRQGNYVFRYLRTKKGGESRLHDKWSVGVGGHINPVDGSPGAEAYEKAFSRELAEEVSILNEKAHVPIVGLINDDSNDVGRVHFGIVHEVDLTIQGLGKINDPALAEGAFQLASLIKDDIDKYENWSKLVIENLL